MLGGVLPCRVEGCNGGGVAAAASSHSLACNSTGKKGVGAAYSP